MTDLNGGGGGEEVFSTAAEVIAAAERMARIFQLRHRTGVKAVNSTAERIEQHLREQRRNEREAIIDTATRIEQHLEEWSARLRRQLENDLQAWDRVGIPPSFVTVAGQGHLEKPLNRLLAWWTEPDAIHGLGREFLRELAKRVGLEEMVQDLDTDDYLTKYAEQCLEDDNSGKEPDLVIRTRNAALMIENKLWAPESGDQYGPYLEIFQTWARQHGIGERQTRAVLCARDQRKVPDGWNQVLPHADLAQILRNLSRLEDAPAWGRIAAVICAAAFEERGLEKHIKQARELLEGTTPGDHSPETVSRLREILPLPPLSTPWDRNNG